ncbi:MAG TPA: cobalamin biosynthesis protein [Propionibacteriaceae bacterium]
MSSGLTLVAGLALGYAADAVLGDPRRRHPVAGFGQLAVTLERQSYADARGPGVVHVGALVGATVGLGVLLERLSAGRPVLRVLVVATSTWAVLGGRSLRREASMIGEQLATGDLPAARSQVRNLVGRETADLSADEVARAALESVAENTSDAVVAPLLWGAVVGVPGLLGYRAINTLDAMIGHRSPRYLRFGWAAARLDDVVNWVPARVAGLAAAVCAPLVGGSPATAVRVVVRDSGQHPSPNAGVVEASFAGALGVRLGGRNVYHGASEERGTLGDGPPVTVADLARANRLAAATSLVSLGVAVAVAWLRGRR